MNYISLPLLIDNSIFNFSFSKYIKDNPQALRIPIQIEFNYGSFPYSLWNGGPNSNYGENLLYPEIITFSSKVINPIRLDYSSILLQENDVFNNHENTILKMLESNGTIIEIADLKIYNYIINKYKDYQFILSENANLIHPFSEEILNTFLERDEFILATIPLSNIDLSKIKYKSKLEIIIGNQCENCPTEIQQQCKILEMNYQYDFSTKTCYNCCYQQKFYNNSNKLLEEIKKYNLMGISHFKIASPNINEIELFNNFLISNFIKDEYIPLCCDYINKQVEGVL